MNIFIENNKEKPSLPEKPEKQVKGFTITFEKKLMVTGLSHQPIPKEESWSKLKLNLDKTFIPFFQRLRINAAGIRLAENTIPSLSCMLFITKQKTALLGFMSLVYAKHCNTFSSSFRLVPIPISTVTMQISDRFSQDGIGETYWPVLIPLLCLHSL